MTLVCVPRERRCPFCLGKTMSLANGRLRRTVRGCEDCGTWTDGKGGVWTKGEGWFKKQTSKGALAVIARREEVE